MSLFRKMSIDALIASSEDPEKKLKRTLGPWSLTALGIGAVIGSGIFTVIGTAIAGQKFDTSVHPERAACRLHRAATRPRWAVPARARRSRFRWCWWRSCAPSPRSAMRNWRR